MMMKPRLYNFGAGPATLPESILVEAQAELLNWQGLGVSILEIGHRTSEFMQLLQDAETDLRQLLAIPDNYHVLFLGGAARTQFAMIPMNLVKKEQQAAFLISGVWSKMAYTEASQLTSAYCIGNSQTADGFSTTPIFNDHLIRDNTAYVYYTPNETVNGIRFAEPPKTGAIPLIADMTSCLLSEPIKIDDYGLIFAGAQKNIAPAGMTLVIIRKDLVARSEGLIIPTMLDYKTHITHHSLYATPPVFNCYLAAKMFQWIKAQGGVDALYKLNFKKAETLYDYIDNSSFYTCPVEKKARSLMNVCFSLPRQALEDDFLTRAAAQGLYALKGHRLVGGMRASLYNAMPMEGVDALIAFMQDYCK